MGRKPLPQSKRKMKYYMSNEGGWPKEISKTRFYTLIRRKGAREKIWINGGIKVARQVILKIY